MKSLQKISISKWLLAALCVSMFSVASVADAADIRHPIERRQHPGRGFFERTPSKPVYRQNHQPQAWTHGWLRSHMGTHRPSQPAQKSWRWQRSSRAELHHPSPRAGR